jgi:hypothetical protein
VEANVSDVDLVEQLATAVAEAVRARRGAIEIEPANRGRRVGYADGPRVAQDDQGVSEVREQDSPSEQADASVNRFLDGLDDERDELAEEQRSRRARLDVPKWEHMVWLVYRVGQEGRIERIDSQEAPGSPPFPEAFVRAGEEGWELVAATERDSYHTLFFKRPKAED